MGHRDCIMKKALNVTSIVIVVAIITILNFFEIIKTIVLDNVFAALMAIIMISSHFPCKSKPLNQQRAHYLYLHFGYLVRTIYVVCLQWNDESKALVPLYLILKCLRVEWKPI